VDDCSTDDTYDIAFELIKGDERFTLIRNRKNGGAMSSSVIGINASGAKDEDIILRIDGDDWLARADALAIIKKAYDTKNCLMTYGSYLRDPMLPASMAGSPYGGGAPTWVYPEECILKNGFREYPYWCTPPRSFKYHLWKRVRDSDLRDADGEYYTMASDLAMVFPILEMAGTRQEAIAEPIYIYNCNNPLSDHNKDPSLQVRVEKEIRKRKKYEPID